MFYNFQKTKIPPNKLFVMGDNREVSRDSRNGLGYIEEDNIIGKVEFVYYPFQNENNRISGRGAKPHLLKFHFIFFKNLLD